MAKAKKLPSGNWRVQASKTINGKMVKKSFTAESKKEAEYIATEWQLKIEEDNAVDNITLHEAFKRYIASKENILSPNTIRVYLNISRAHFQGIMHRKINSLTMEDFQREINISAATSSPKTVRNVNGLLSAVLKMFRPDFNLNTSLPQKKPTELYIPDDNDIKKLMAIVKDTEMEIPILLAAFGPMRRGEICALTSDDIVGNVVLVNKAVAHDKNGKIVVKAPKNVSSYREIDFPDFVIEKLQGIKGKITNISPAHISRRFKVILKNNGIPEFRFHDLRHYNVSILHAMNVPDKYIMARGGWRTNATMNKVYNHVLKNKQNEYTNEINKHFSNIYIETHHETSHETE
jgi:integrase